jgi:CRP-like cAMP-binding protein
MTTRGGTPGYDHALYLMYLEQVPMFRRCSSEELEHVARLAGARQLEEGDDIVREGDRGDEFFVLASGTVRVTRGDHEVATLEPGGYFGELALFEPAPRNATVTATEPVTVVVLGRDDFRRALDESPTIRDALLTGMAHRLHELDAKA